MTSFNVADEITYEIKDDRVRFAAGGISTDWMDMDDSFIKRIETEKINPAFPLEHIACEIKIKNLLDEGISFLMHERYAKAIDMFDEVIFYDECHVDALIGKSYALKGQGHFVKALRYYRRAAKAGFSDVEYQKDLIKRANEERDSFPKIKRNIYMGDEAYSRGDYLKAAQSYDNALKDSSKFKDKILHRLLNKKGSALIRLERFDEALECFGKSLDVKKTDYAIFAQGYCRYELDLEVSDDFKSLLKIDKSHMLKQALILNEIGCFEEALEVCEFLFENHFTVDDFYFRMLAVKGYALGELGHDGSEVREVLEKLAE